MSNVKHQPATPLPWHVGGVKTPKRGEYPAYPINNAAHENIAQLPIYARGGSNRDAAYIAHAANAYPKLVEALRFGLRAIEGKMARNAGLTAHEIAFRDEAEPLLRELGEDT